MNIVYSQQYNVILLSLQVLLYQLIVVLQPWLLWICGFLTANDDKHHEEEALPNLCCSLLFSCSLRSPVYIQEGRGANYSHPLLKVR
jgi:hypothetical protein